MNLQSYFATAAGLSVAELRRAIGAKSDAQIRQWQHRYGDREPDPANCVAIERATKGMVTRIDLRPDDWYRIWPELAAAHPDRVPKTAPEPAEGG